MFCRKCGKEIDNAAAYCPGCGTTVVGERSVSRDNSSDKAMGYIVPVGTSGLSIAAGYVGLFSILLFPAPIALIMGILALKDLKKNPRPHGKGRAIFAIVMGVIFSIILLVVIAQSILSGTR
jgi:hypothetical protein